MRPSRSCIDYNKQLTSGELGALVGTPLLPLVISQFTRNSNIISGSAVLGGYVTGSALWFIVKIHDEKRRGSHSMRRLAGQIAWFSPAAFVVGLLVYQPTLFLVTRWLIEDGIAVVGAVLASQTLAFALFLAAMNVYRLLLHRFAGQRI